MTVNIVDDSVEELSERITLTLGTPVNAVLDGTAERYIDILDNDAAIQVTAPNGAESWDTGTSQQITWTSGLTDTVDLFYSLDNGVTWILISAGEVNDGSYDWSVPITRSTTVFVKISASSSTLYDLSDAAFTINYAGSIWYVDLAASGAANGTTWTDAYTTIEDALGSAADGEEIWVAEGIYTKPAAATVTLTMKDGVAIYGGFPTAGSTFAARNSVANVTTLDGEDVAYHVVTGASRALLDGFVLTGGLANGSDPDNKGGAMLNDTVSDLVISKCIIEDNTATGGAGGMSNVDSSLSVLATTLQNNHGGGTGGMENSNSSPMLSRVQFISNDQSGGMAGGLTNWGSSAPIIDACLFDSNAGYNGGALYADSGTLSITNTAFVRNTGEIYAGAFMTGGADIICTNCTIAQNVTLAWSGVMDSWGGTITLINSIVWDNEAPGLKDFGAKTPATVTRSIIAQSIGYTDGGGNIAAYPDFIDPDNGDFRIGQSSPAIDAALGSLAPLKDLALMSRLDDSFISNTGTGSPDYADLGAWEFVGRSSLQVLTPNGGESWAEGSSQTITWRASAMNQISIEVSRDGGATWTLVAEPVTATLGTYTWDPVTGPGGGESMIRLSNYVDSNTWEVSDLPFAITSDTIWYVKDGATGSGSGTSWADAMGTIEGALSAASFGNQIFVATGTYTPPAAASAWLTLRSGISIYGGFPATGAPPIGDRDPSTFPTILDGQSTVDHILVGADNALLDGVTVTGGLAQSAFTGDWGSYGAGMLIDNTSPTVVNVTFHANAANFYSGGVFVTGSLAAPLLDKCSFTDNIASQGAGISVTYGARPTITDSLFSGNATTGSGFGGGLQASDFAEPSVTGCTFTGNSASYGGGVSFTNVSVATLADNIFDTNISENYGGALYLSNTTIVVDSCIFDGNKATDVDSGKGGAIYQYGSSSSTFLNCRFFENQAASTVAPYDGGGGALYNSGSASADIIHCTFYGNTTMGSGGAIFSSDGDITVINSIMWDDVDSTGNEIHIDGAGTLDVTYSAVEGISTGTGNIVPSLPIFEDVSTGDLHLATDSDCLDVAHDEGVTWDLEDNPRPSGTGFDMGAYEL